MAETWDESKPAGSRSPTLGDDDIREFKRAMRERLAEDHDFEATESPAFGAAGGYTIGKHKYLTLVEQASAKTTASDEVAFRCKDVSGSKEIMIQTPSAGSERQLTKNAGLNLNLNSGDFASGIIATASLADLAVSEAKLASSAVTETKIGTGAVTESKIGTGAVTNTKIGSGAVSYAKMAASAVATDTLAANAVTMAKLYPGMFQITGDYTEKTNNTTSNVTVWATKFLCPANPTTLRAYVEVKAQTGYGGYLRFYVGTSYVETNIFTNTSYAWVLTSAINISGLTPGLGYDLYLTLRDNSSGAIVYLRGLAIFNAS